MEFRAESNCCNSLLRLEPKNLTKQRLELVRLVLIPANAPEAPRGGRLPFHLGQGGNRPGKMWEFQNQQPLPMAGSFCGLQMIKSGWSHSLCGYRQLWLVTQLVTQLWHTLFEKDIIQHFASLIAGRFRGDKEGEYCREWDIENPGYVFTSARSWVFWKAANLGWGFEARISLNFDRRLLFQAQVRPLFFFFWKDFGKDRKESHLVSFDLVCVLTAICEMKVRRQEGEKEPYTWRLVWLFIF